MSLRITAPSTDGRPRRGPSGEAIEGDIYMSRLIKLIPAEAVAVYPLLQNRALGVVADVNRVAPTTVAAPPAAPTGPNVFLGTNPPAIPATPAAPVANIAQPVEPTQYVPIVTDHWLPIAIAWMVLLLVILIRWQATRTPGGDAQWGAIAIAAVSFFLWVPAMNGSFGVLEMANVSQLIDWHPAIQKFIPELLLVFWTILIPVFYKPQN